jgi:3-oxoacyl-[acyl-carrier-protein] synthase II
MQRVVITGIGVITPIAQSVIDFDTALRAGKTGFSRLDAGNTAERFSDGFPIKVAAVVKDFDPLPYFNDKKDAKRTDRFAQFAVAAAKQAVADTGTDFSDLDRYKKGILFGVGIGGLQLTLDEHTKMTERGSNRISALYIPMMIANMASGAAALGLTDFCGDNFVCSSACASSTHAVGEAFRKIKDGYLDVCIAGGAESVIDEFPLAAFNNMKALSKSADPERASIPFDKERDGFVMGEGASALVLESYDHAMARGAHIYAEIAGYAATDDAYHITAPAPDGAAAAYAMTAAVKEAGLSLTDIDYINAHGTATPMNDKTETAAIKRAFGDYANNLKVNSSKSLFGHMLGAAGAAEAAAVALQIAGGYIHKTAGLLNPDPECDLDNCPNGYPDTKIRAALSNSLGFGGHNACVLLKEV